MDHSTLVRSPDLMSREDAALLVIDVQQKLLPLVLDHATVLWNCRRLVDAARLLELPVLASEQYPKGLGPTVSELSQRLGQVPSKLTFSCGGCQPLVARLRSQGRHQLLLAGIETHVCVQQSALDLLSDGFQVFVAVDATSARRPVDRDVALRRLESSGAILTTTEAAMFEWCEVAGTEQFKQISALVRESPPEAMPRNSQQ